jgi:hypothetical protein
MIITDLESGEEVTINADPSSGEDEDANDEVSFVVFSAFRS